MKHNFIIKELKDEGGGGNLQPFYFLYLLLLYDFFGQLFIILN
jgi:hypothetical protein